MRLSKKFGALAMVLAIGACGDDSGGGTSLTEAEKTALTEALIGTGELGGFGAFAGYAVELTGSTGKLNAGASAAVAKAMDRAMSLSSSGIAAASYDGVGFAMDYSYDFSGESYSGWFIGVVGWNGLDGSAGTVDELVVVGGGSDEGSLPTTTSGIIGEDAEVFAMYWDGTDAFIGISGSAAITSSSFTGGTTDCSGSDQGVTLDCEVQVGTLGGDFDFEADNFSGGTYTQTPVVFSGLPAVRIVIAISGG
jgi:hypothetical protein